MVGMAAIDSMYVIISCPYCNSRFENKEKLSQHIDRIHHSADLMRSILGYANSWP